jgi:hypothetical protein
MLVNLLTAAALAFVGVRLASSARTAVGAAARRRTALIVRGLRPRHFARAPVVLLLVAVTATLLLQVPGLSIGWWSAIGGSGTIAIGSTTLTRGSALEWLVPALFLLLLAPALPLFAEREEIMFRQGAESWTWARRWWMGLQFGLIHLIMGIPIAVALALSIGGWYFQWSYLQGHRRAGGDGREAVLESTRSHLAYNLEVLSLVALVLILTGSLS